jgi:hypothetical protein
MKDWIMGIAVVACSFTLFVLLPFGLAWALGRALGAS